MKPSNHVLVLCGSVALAAGLRLAFADYYRTELRHVGTSATAARVSEIGAGWSASRYTSFALSGTDQAFLERIAWSSLPLSEVQKAKARQRVAEVIRFLQAPTFEAYYRLKTEGIHYSYARAPWTSNLLASSSVLPSFVTAEQTIGTVKLLWDELLARDGSRAPARLIAVSLDSVSAAVTHNNTGPGLLAGPVKKGFTVAVEFLNPGFRYRSELGHDSQPLLLELSFLAKADSSGGSGPIHISLLWLEEDQNWAPNRLIADALLRFQTLF